MKIAIAVLMLAGCAPRAIKCECSCPQVVDPFKWNIPDPFELIISTGPIFNCLSVGCTDTHNAP